MKLGGTRTQTAKMNLESKRKHHCFLDYKDKEDKAIGAIELKRAMQVAMKTKMLSGELAFRIVHDTYHGFPFDLTQPHGA